MRNSPSIASISVSIAAAGVLLATAAACSGGTANSGQASTEGTPSVAPSSPSGTSAPGTQAASPSQSAAPLKPPSASPAPSPSTLSAAEKQLAALSLEQRVGQLFMVAAKATDAEPGTMDALTKYHAGNVYLSGRSKAGTGATAAQLCLH
jgi:beta-N-acetylhexosaminidase